MKKRWPAILGLVAAITVAAIFLTSASLKRKAQSANCGNQLISIGLATRLWAEDNGGRLPLSLAVMSNELNTPKILICAGDKSTPLAESWSSLNTTNASYQVVTGDAAFGANAVFLRCPIHGFVLRADGTVYDGNKQLRKGL